MTTNEWQSDTSQQGFKILFDDWLAGTLVDEEIEELEGFDSSNFDEYVAIAEVEADKAYYIRLNDFLCHVGEYAENHNLPQIATLIIRINVKLIRKATKNDFNVPLVKNFWKLLTFCKIDSHIVYDMQQKRIAIGINEPILIHQDIIPSDFRFEILKRFLPSEVLHVVTNSKTPISKDMVNRNHTINRKVFLSYSREDEDFVIRLQHDLDKYSQIQTWRDKTNIIPGSPWTNSVQQALEDCDAMILVMSTNSLNSSEVQREYDYFISHKKYLIPIKIDQCALPYRLDNIQYIDFTTKDYTVALEETINFLCAK